MDVLGRHRLPPQPLPEDLEARVKTLNVAIEARRQNTSGSFERWFQSDRQSTWKDSTRRFQIPINLKYMWTISSETRLQSTWTVCRYT